MPGVVGIVNEQEPDAFAVAPAVRVQLEVNFAFTTEVFAAPSS